MSPNDRALIVDWYVNKRRSIAYILTQLPHRTPGEIIAVVDGLKRKPTNIGRTPVRIEDSRAALARNGDGQQAGE